MMPEEADVAHNELTPEEERVIIYKGTEITCTNRFR